MILNQTRLQLLATLIALAVFLLSSSAQAQQPELVEAFVYGVNATTPGEVFANFSPPQVDEIYILANRINVVSPKRTNVYFWPASQRYRGHWETLNEPVDGVLEILEQNQLLSTVHLTSYTVHYANAGTTRGELYVGKEALDADAQFYFSREASLQAMTAFREERMEWLEASRIAQIAGKPVPRTKRPQRPSSFTTLSVGLQEGFPLILETGTYQIRMRGSDGDIISGSQRTVHVFESRQTSLGFEVIHEQSWTTPKQIDSAADVIEAEPNSVIYLRPRLTHEYPALEIEKLRDTQFSGDVESNWHWLADTGYKHSSNDVLEIIRRGRLVEQITYASYTVRFALDQETGYEVIPFDAKTPQVTPNVDFTGYRVELPQGIDRFTVQLKTNGELPYDGAVRQVRVLPQDLSVFLIPAALLIAILFLSGFVLWQRLINPSQIRTRFLSGKGQLRSR